MPNICIEKLDSDSDSENEEVKQLPENTGIKKANTLGPVPVSMSGLLFSNKFRRLALVECV